MRSRHALAKRIEAMDNMELLLLTLLDFKAVGYRWQRRAND